MRLIEVLPRFWRTKSVHDLLLDRASRFCNKTAPPEIRFMGIERVFYPIQMSLKFGLWESKPVVFYPLGRKRKTTETLVLIGDKKTCFGVMCNFKRPVVNANFLVGDP